MPRTPAVKDVTAVTPHFTRPRSQASKQYRATATTWPKAGPADLGVAGTASTVNSAAISASSPSSPVSVRAVNPKHGRYAGPGSVTVDVRDHNAAVKAGVSGLLFTVTPSGTGTGSAQVALNYASFAQAYGGGFGSRLRLVELPACALTTPQRAECRKQTPLLSTNNLASKTVMATVQLAGGSTRPSGPPTPSPAPSAPQESAAPSGSPSPAASPSPASSANMPSSSPTGQGKASAGSMSTQLVAEAPMTATSSSGQTMVMAAVSGSSDGDGGGPSGTYSATTLKPSGTWSGGGSSGSFTYTYPIQAPSAVSSLIPKLSLNYDSGTVDGQTAATQAQASWAGDGWSTPQSFVEESFTSCGDDPEGSASPVSTPDECYAGPVLTMSLNGATTALVWDSSKNIWKPQDDSGEVVQHVTNSNNGTGTYNTDYWTITQRDGTVFEFGRNELPGWSSGKPTTNSVDSMPVYSAHSGDPCYSSSGFSSSVCTMAYRWNLDYVKDIHGNAMAYYYKQDTNYYGEDNGAKDVSYIRDSHPDHIDYGFTDGNAYGTVADKVLFTTGDRCVSGTCDPLNSSTSSNWPDVPYDLVCDSGTTCSSYAPSFFSTVRLTQITTEQYSPSSSTYVPVDSWALNETMPTSGDGNATLWLSSITHTGQDTQGGGSSSPITLPSVSFGAVDLQNRVDTTTDGLPPLYRFRISSITTETGSVIGVQYGQTNACSAPVTVTPSSNTSSCYPVYWTPQGYSAPILDWFNKYVVQKVTQTDPTGGAPTMATSYEYAKPAWHYDDNEVVQAKYRTYGQWRGYGDVKTLTGDGVNDKQTLSETTYYQGMSDDNDTTTVNVTDSQGGTHEDLDQLAGQPLETTSYLGNGGPVDHSTITSYWVSPATATRTRSGLPNLTANMVNPIEAWTRQALTDGGTTTWRTTETDTTYDATTSDTDFGLETASYAHTVPANSAYDRCTTTTYAPANTSENLVGLAASTETDSVACGGFTEGSTSSVPGSVNTLTAPTSVNRPSQVVTATRTFYDDPSLATTWPQPSNPTFPQTSAPTTGDASVSQKASDYAGGAFTWQTTKTQVYDSHGRVTASYDADGNKTTTAYTDNSAGVTTGTTKTNALSQSTTTTLDPARGLTLTSTDPNGVVSTFQYDPLGRITSVWLDSRATISPANYTYSYQVSNSGITAVTTNKLNDESGYQTSTALYDALLRVRQTQTPTPQGGRMVTDTFYDTRGWTSAKYNGWWDSATTPNTTLVSAANLKDEVPNQDYYTYDGLGRPVIDQAEKDNTVVSTTTTVYNGDRTTVIPPTGGTVKTTVTDPMGRTSELDEYTANPLLNTPSDTFTGIWSVAGGTYQATIYGFDSHGNQNTTTAGGQTWTNTYNLLGQITTKQDPDAGTSTITYDADGNVLQTTDARGKTISYTYDPLARKTAEYDAPTSSQSSSNQLASWVYDNSNDAITGMKYPVGHLTTETAYQGGAAYTTQAKGFNVFGESIGEITTIPSSTEGTVLGTSYTFQHTYTATTGLPLKDVYPSGGGLPSETVTHTYSTALDLPTGLGGTNGYAQTTNHDAYGRVQQETLGSSTNEAWITNTYDPHTGHLTDQLITRSTTPTNVDEEGYTYDPAGNVTSQTDTRLGSTSSTETQCYQYDQLDRLTQAWTATDNCAATPSTGNSSTVGDNLSATSAYWTNWSFDALGNRTSETDHSTTGGTDTATSYTYNGNNTNQPDTLTSTSTTGGTTASTSYAYDANGNTTTRTTPTTGTQTLTWNDTGQLTAITGGGAGSSNFLYDADGNLLLQKDPGTTTLYLPGEQLALNTSDGDLQGTRYYTLPGGGTAVRTGDAATGTSTYSFEITDQHGTSGLYLDSTAQTPTWRQFTPYGGTRGDTSTWIDNRGFLNDPTDTDTGLTVIGARQYDPTLGRFISLDPLFEATSPQQLGGYAYAGDDPIGSSDPTGMDENTTLCEALGCIDPPGITSGGRGGQSCCKVGGGGYGESIGHPCYYVLVDPCGTPYSIIGGYGAGYSTSSGGGYGSSGISEEHNSGLDDSSTGWWTSTCAGKMCWELGETSSKEIPDHITPAVLDFFKQMGQSLWDVAKCETWIGGGGAGHDQACEVAGAVVSGGIDAPEMPGLTATEDGGDGGLASGTCSFNSSTPVLMADGKTKPIGKIKPGDRVEAGDPTTGRHQGTRTVLARLVHHDNDLLNLTIQTGPGRSSTIHTTANHPFWDDTLHTWVHAGQLQVGDNLETATDRHARILAVQTRSGSADMYNLTIQQLHTYYVLAGTTPILVHNTGCGLAFGPERPLGTESDWSARVADNGKGIVWQAPGSTGNANSVRIMNATPRYPNGYVRFYNSHGQPIGLDGKPGPNSLTHIPLNPDGTYSIPLEW